MFAKGIVSFTFGSYVAGYVTGVIYGLLASSHLTACYIFGSILMSLTTFPAACLYKHVNANLQTVCIGNTAVTGRRKDWKASAAPYYFRSIPEAQELPNEQNRKNLL